MTEVSGPGSSGEIAKIALLFLGTAGPQGSEGARGPAIALAGRHHRSRGGFGNGAVHAAHQVPRFERSAEEHGEDWGHALCFVGRLTRQKLSTPRADRVPKGTGHCERTDRVADPHGSGGSEKVLWARATPRTTVHAAWWSGPRPSGFDLRSQDRGPTSVDIALHRGRPRATEHQRDAARSAAGKDNILARSIGLPK